MFSQAKIYSGPWAEYSTMVINFMTAEGKFLLLAWTLSHPEERLSQRYTKRGEEVTESRSRNYAGKFLLLAWTLSHQKEERLSKR